MDIYKITNLINGKIYIGKTKYTADARFKAHVINSKNESNDTYLYRAMRKYGLDNFLLSILEQVDDEQLLNDKEIYWIDKLKSTDPAIGYNIAKGGEGGDTFSNMDEASKIARAEKTTKNHLGSRIYVTRNNINRKIKPSDLESYLSEGWSIGKYLNPETKESLKLKVSEKNSGKVVVNNGEKSIKISIEELDTYLIRGYQRGLLITPTKLKYTEDLRQKANLEKEAKQALWDSEQHFCECCGKVMTEKYGSGRFCSRSCASTHKHSLETKELLSLLNLSGVCGRRGLKSTQEHRDKISKAIKEYNLDPENKKCWVTDGVTAIKVLSKDLDSYLAKGYKKGRKTKTSNFTAWNKGLTAETDERVALNTKHTYETKLKKKSTDT